MSLIIDRIFSTYEDPLQKDVCEDCLCDPGMKKFIYRHGFKGKCSYCEEAEKTVCSLTVILPHIENSLKLEYCEPSRDDFPWDSENEEFVFSSSDTKELLEELEFCDNDDILNDISSCFSDHQWCSRYTIKTSGDEDFLDKWPRFKEIVKRKSRFLFLDYKIFEWDYDSQNETIADFLSSLAMVQEICGSKRILEKDTTIFRARIAKRIGEFELNAEELGPPPYSVTAKCSNRMTPAGISAFYGALQEDTAICEVKDQEQSAVAIAHFQTTKELVLIDFTAPLPVPSLFEEKMNELRTELKIINEFVKEISKPCTPDNFVHVEYVPTQIITDYFKSHFWKNGQHAHGLVYKSSLKAGGECIVLFLDDIGYFPSKKIDLSRIPLNLKDSKWK